MYFDAIQCAARRLLAGGVMLLGLSAAAQQSLQLDKPADNDLSAPVKALTPSSTYLPSDFNAPASLSSLFGKGPGPNFSILPGSQGLDQRGLNGQQWREAQDRKNNWTLMTPEEVLDIPTPEKILGIVNPEDDPRLSAEERFLQRQDRQSAMLATNGAHNANAWHWANDGRAGAAEASGAAAGLIPDQPQGMDSRLFSPFLGNGPKAAAQGASTDQRLDPDQRPNSIWDNSFGLPAPEPKSTPEQLAGMERFRLLMDPTPAEKPLATPVSASQPTETPDPVFQALPAFNPYGRSVSALENDSSKPVGLTPLAGVMGAHPASAKKPEPLVQPPPWLQNSGPPQLQF